MKNYLLLSGVALLALATPATAQNDTPQAYPESSGLDTPVDDKPANQAQAAAPTGDPVLDRLNQLEARVKQLEARNAELEAHSSEVETRVQNVEVRAATAVQPGPAPTFADVNGNFTFKPRGTLQLDYAGYSSRRGNYDFNNGTDIRRARFGFEGTAFKNFKWRLDAEYVKNSVNLLDAYIQYPLTNKLTLTVGQHKAPYGLEANTTDALNTFLERGMASNAFGAVGAERRVGASLTYATDHINASVGLFGSGEAIIRNASSPDEGYGINGRFVWEPINDTDKLVHLGVSGYRATNFQAVTTTTQSVTISGTPPTGRLVTTNVVTPNVVRLSERPNSRVDGGVIVDTGNIANVDNATFLGAEAALVKGPFSLQGEYGRLSLDRLGSPNLDFDGFYVFGSWFITGESRTFKNGVVDRLKPFKDFEPGSGGIGAIELAVRYDQLDLTDKKLSPLARKAKSWTGGVNWYLNPNTRLIFNYIRFSGENSPLYVLPTPVAGTGSRTAKGDAYQTRLQFDF